MLERRLRLFKKKLLAALHKENADFGLNLVSNAEMNRVRQALRTRRDFKGKEARKIAHEKKVNVLAFPESGKFPHPESPKRWLGEVYLNLDSEGREPERLKTLMAHGVLHLLGYRHDRLRDTMKMEALEKNLYRKLKK
jgi:ssRNA-specific RNase YbeY (16S rRNA maturation enzyme)